MFECRDLFDINFPLLNLLTQPVLFDIDILEFGDEFRRFFDHKSHSLKVVAICSEILIELKINVLEESFVLQKLY